MIIEQALLDHGWKTTAKLSFRHFTREAFIANTVVYIECDNPSKVVLAG